MSQVHSLPPTKEVEAFASLSVGIPSLLDRCDLVSPDSSFILYDLDSFYNFEIDSLNPYCRNNSNYLNLEALLNIYADISSGQNKRISKKELRDVVDENILRRDILSYYLEVEALSRENFLFTEQVYQETHSTCISINERIELMLEQKKDILPRHFKKNYFPSNKKRRQSPRGLLLSSGGYGKTIKHLDNECAVEMKEIFEEIETQTGKIKKMLDSIYDNNKILLSRGRFRHMDDHFDEDIIDTILNNGEKVGIISCDYKGFRQKISKVMEFRKKRRMQNPNVFLLEPRRALFSYNLLEYSNEDFSPVYLIKGIRLANHQL